MGDMTRRSRSLWISPVITKNEHLEGAGFFQPGRHHRPRRCKSTYITFCYLKWRTHADQKRLDRSSQSTVPDHFAMFAPACQNAAQYATKKLNFIGIFISHYKTKAKRLAGLVCSYLNSFGNSWPSKTTERTLSNQE